MQKRASLFQDTHTAVKICVHFILSERNCCETLGGEMEKTHIQPVTVKIHRLRLTACPDTLLLWRLPFSSIEPSPSQQPATSSQSIVRFRRGGGGDTCCLLCVLLHHWRTLSVAYRVKSPLSKAAFTFLTRFLQSPTTPHPHARSLSINQQPTALG